MGKMLCLYLDMYFFREERFMGFFRFLKEFKVILRLNIIMFVG